MIRGAAIAVVLTALSGCAVAVQARGTVAPGQDGRPWIQAINGKERPLMAGRHHVLHHLDGEFVRLEGTLRRGAIEVERLSVEEGRSGMPVYLGFCRVDRDGGVYVDDPSGSITHRVVGPLIDELADAAGEPVLVEGFVVGRLTVEAMRVTVIRPKEHR